MSTWFVTVRYSLYLVICHFSVSRITPNSRFCNLRLSYFQNCFPTQFLSSQCENPWRLLPDKNTSSVAKRHCARVLTRVYWLISCIPIGNDSDGPSSLRCDSPDLVTRLFAGNPEHSY